MDKFEIKRAPQTEEGSTAGGNGENSGTESQEKSLFDRLSVSKMTDEERKTFKIVKDNIKKEVSLIGNYFYEIRDVEIEGLIDRKKVLLCRRIITYPNNPRITDWILIDEVGDVTLNDKEKKDIYEKMYENIRPSYRF